MWNHFWIFYISKDDLVIQDRNESDFTISITICRDHKSRNNYRWFQQKHRTNAYFLKRVIRDAGSNGGLHVIDASASFKQDITDGIRYRELKIAHFIF